MPHAVQKSAVPSHERHVLSHSSHWLVKLLKKRPKLHSDTQVPFCKKGKPISLFDVWKQLVQKLGSSSRQVLHGYEHLLLM